MLSAVGIVAGEPEFHPDEQIIPGQKPVAGKGVGGIPRKNAGHRPVQRNQHIVGWLDPQINFAGKPGLAALVDRTGKVCGSRGAGQQIR